MRDSEYMMKENEIYRKAPVKRFSLCTWLSSALFGVFDVCVKQVHYNTRYIDCGGSSGMEDK